MKITPGESGEKTGKSEHTHVAPAPPTWGADSCQHAFSPQRSWSSHGDWGTGPDTTRRALPLHGWQARGGARQRETHTSGGSLRASGAEAAQGSLPGGGEV